MVEQSGRRWRACALASVRRSNCTCGSPACSFQEESLKENAREGDRCKRLTSPNSPYSMVCGSCFQPPSAPTVASMRPESPHDPGIELSEELSDVRSLVILTPTPQHGIHLRNDLLGRKRYPSLRQLADPILEPIDRLLARVGVYRSRRSTSTELAGGSERVALA